MTESLLPAGYRIRELLPADLPAFIELGLPTCRAMYGRESISAPDFRKNFEQFVRELAFEAGSRIFVVETADHKLAAQIWLHQIQNRFNAVGELWIWDLTVREDFRRRGLGRALLRLAEQKAEELRLTEVWLLVAGGNDNAIRLYQAAGLSVAGLLLSTRHRAPDAETPPNVAIDNAQIRKLCGEDVERLYRLWDAAGLSYRPTGRDHPDWLRRHLNASRPGGWCIVRNDVFVAGALIAHDGRKGWIERVATVPDLRRTGLARVLVEICTQSLKAAGAQVIGALIEEGNTASRRLFENCGYVDSPTVRYYSTRDDPGS